jgi:putative DNA primase/helicase
MIESKNLRRAANGKWRVIIETLGIDVPDDPNKHSGCPMCGNGNNSHRFRFDDKGGDGTWICTQCGAGDGIALVQRSLGMTFPDALKAIADCIGYVEEEGFKPIVDTTIDDKKKWLNELWSSSIELTGSCQASKYLYNRGLSIAPNDIRFCPQCYEKETKTKMPAMVAKVKNKDGVPVTIHRTYLDGIKKADLKSPKKLMPAISKLSGCAIRLFPVGSDIIGVAEGIETAIAASQLHFMPVWATISTTIMESFEPPNGVSKVVIFSDNDTNFAGQKSAYRLANKLYLKDYIVEVQIPTLNDYADEALAVKMRSIGDTNTRQEA